MRFFPKKRPVNNLHLVLLFIIFILLLSSLFHPFHSFCSHSQQVVPHTFYYRQPESSVYSSADPSIAHVSAHRVPTTLLSPLHLRGQFPRPLTAPHLRHLSFRCSAWGLSPTGDLLTSQAWPSGSTRAFMLPEATLSEGLVKSTCFFGIFALLVSNKLGIQSADCVFIETQPVPKWTQAVPTRLFKG